MSEITNEYSSAENDNSLEELPTNVSNIIGKACYTGRLSYVDEISDRLNNSEDIIKIHEKINELVKSFNEDTNHEYKELFETRDNYCNNDHENCHKCNTHLFLSCVNYYRYMSLEMNPTELNKYFEVLANINNEIINLYIQNQHI